MKQYMLRRQLRALGATKNEQDSLQKLANSIAQSQVVPHLDPESKEHIAHTIGIPTHKDHRATLLVSATSFAVLTLLIVSAQFASPGSALDSIKQGTDQVRSVIQPGFKVEELKKLDDSATNSQEQQLEKQKQDDQNKKTDDNKNNSKDTSDDKKSNKSKNRSNTTQNRYNSGFNYPGSNYSRDDNDSDKYEYPSQINR